MPAELMLGTEYHMNHLKDEMLGYNRVIDQKQTQRVHSYKMSGKIRS